MDGLSANNERPIIKATDLRRGSLWLFEVLIVETNT
jgi:hypothetical protein